MGTSMDSQACSLAIPNTEAYYPRISMGIDQRRWGYKLTICNVPTCVCIKYTYFIIFQCMHVLYVRPYRLFEVWIYQLPTRGMHQPVKVTWTLCHTLAPLHLGVTTKRPQTEIEVKNVGLWAACQTLIHQDRKWCCCNKLSPRSHVSWLENMK